jgi:large subunit ribosomal protein L21
MFAIFEDGSRQYRVSEGDLVKVDFREAEPGTRVEFPRVLLFSAGEDLKVGQPVVDGARVLGEVAEQTSVKTYIGKFRRRKNYRRLRGHRQPFTCVRIRHILLPGQDAPAMPPALATPPPDAPAPATPPPDVPAPTA